MRRGCAFDHIIIRELYIQGVEVVKHASVNAEWRLEFHNIHYLTVIPCFHSILLILSMLSVICMFEHVLVFPPLVAGLGSYYEVMVLFGANNLQLTYITLFPCSCPSPFFFHFPNLPLLFLPRPSYPFLDLSIFRLVPTSLPFSFLL